MVRRCCAPMCKNSDRITKNIDQYRIQFHSFPIEDKIRLKKWLQAMKKDCFKPTKSSVLCSIHFRHSDYLSSVPTIGTEIIRRLKKDAIPSVFEHLRVNNLYKTGDDTTVRRDLKCDNDVSDPAYFVQVATSESTSEIALNINVENNDSQPIIIEDASMHDLKIMCDANIQTTETMEHLQNLIGQLRKDKVKLRRRVTTLTKKVTLQAEIINSWKQRKENFEMVRKISTKIPPNNCRSVDLSEDQMTKSDNNIFKENVTIVENNTPENTNLFINLIEVIEINKPEVEEEISSTSLDCIDTEHVHI